MAPKTTSVRRMKFRSRPYYPRMCKLVNSTSAFIDSLPDDVLSEILARVPTDDLIDRARVVCRRWSLIISSAAFASTHLPRCSYGLVVTEPGGGNPIYVKATTQGEIEVSRLSCNSTAKGSCNGLVAGYLTPSLTNASCISNPATKKEFILPEVDSRFLFRTFSGIAYGATSREYKVVQLHGDPDPPMKMQPAILTVGVDNSWRQLQVEHIPDNLRHLLYANPAVTEGFIHWGARDTGKLLTLNVETEIITETSVPPQARARAFLSELFYLSTGRHLSLLFRRRDLMWEVWEMKSDTGEWRKCRHFQFASNQIDSGHRDFRIFGWVKYPDVLACSSVAGTLIFYNLHTHEIDSTELPGHDKEYNAFMHKNTLIWPIRCVKEREILTVKKDDKLCS